jgi:hypothetical protein
MMERGYEKNAAGGCCGRRARRHFSPLVLARLPS